MAKKQIRRVIGLKRSVFGVAAGAAGAFKYGRSRTQSKNKKKRTIEPVPVTGHYDYKVDYRYKRMPRRKRKRWMSFKRKVNWVSTQQGGLKSFVVNHKAVINAATDNSNGSHETLYSIDGVTNCKDVGDIMRGTIGSTVFDNELSTTVDNIRNQRSITFASANIEVTISNSGSNTIILEAYHFRCRKTHLQMTDGSYNDPWGIYRLGFLKSTLITDPQTSAQIPSSAKPTFATPGTTPFQSTRFCSHFKVLRRSKFTIPAGGQIQLSLRIPGNKVINAGNIRSMIVAPRLSEGWIYQFQGIPGQDAGNPVHALPGQINVFSVRRYAFYQPYLGTDETAIKSE